MRAFNFGPVKYFPVRPPEQVALLPDMGGGVELVASSGGTVRVSTCERAMVDVLHSPALGGSWEENLRSLSMVEFFDLDAAIQCTIVLDSAVTSARVGYFLSLHRERLFVEEAHLPRLAEHAPTQARYLDTTRAPGRLVRPWNLIVPEWVLGQRWEEVA